MNPMFPEAEKIFVPIAMKYSFEMGDDGFHPIDEKNHYTDILVKVLGEEKGFESAIVDVEITSRFVVLYII